MLRATRPKVSKIPIIRMNIPKRPNFTIPTIMAVTIRNMEVTKAILEAPKAVNSKEAKTKPVTMETNMAKKATKRPQRPKKAKNVRTTFLYAGKKIKKKFKRGEEKSFFHP